MEKKTKYFDLSYDEMDAPWVPHIIQTMDATFESVLKDFHLPARNERYSFFLCQDVAQYISLTGKTEAEYEDWMVGWADYHLKRLCILSPRVVVGKSDEEMDKVIIHEIVHIALDALGNPDEVNLFLAEGIAVAYAEQTVPESIDPKAYPSISELWTEEGFYEYGGYDYAGIYVKHFISRYGTELFKKIYTGEESIFSYLDESFEQSAIAEYLHGGAVSAADAGWTIRP